MTEKHAGACTCLRIAHRCYSPVTLHAHIATAHTCQVQAAWLDVRSVARCLNTFAQTFPATFMLLADPSRAHKRQENIGMLQLWLAGKLILRMN